MKPLFLTGFLLTSVFLSGCQGSGEAVTLRIQEMQSDLGVKGSALTIAVSPFEDQRPSTDHLGLRIHLGGGKTYFDLMDGHFASHVTRSFLEFLNASGFSASPAEGTESPDVRIDAVVKTFDVKATDRLLVSSLEVDTTMEFTIHNSTDGSTVRVTIGAGGAYEKMLFEQENLEALISDVLKEGFVQLLEETEIQGKTLRRRG